MDIIKKLVGKPTQEIKRSPVILFGERGDADHKQDYIQRAVDRAVTEDMHRMAASLQRDPRTMQTCGRALQEKAERSSARSRR